MWTWAWAALALVTLVAVVGDDAGVFAPDTKPELYLNPDRLVGRAVSAWQPDPHLGQANYNTGILPVAVLMMALRAVGLPPWLMQRLVMVVLLLVGAWGAGRLVTELGERRGAGPWLAGLVYAWHPWVVVGAATLPVRLPHAVLPWLLLATHRTLVRGGWSQAALTGLVYGSMAGINGGVVNLMFVLPVVLLVGWEVTTRQVGLRRAVGATMRIGLFAVGVSLYWLVPAVLATASSAGDVLATTEAPAAIGRLSPPSEVVRGMGMWTSYIVLDGQVENPAQLRLLTSPHVVTAGFLLSAAAATGLMGMSRRLAGYVVTCWAVGFAVMVGLSTAGGRSPVGAALARAFEAVPALLAFRTTNKLGSLLVLATALSLGAGLGTTAWRRHLHVRAATATVAVAGLVVVAAGPLLPGQLHPLRIPIPDYWFRAAAAADHPADDRLLLLPGNAQTRYTWGYRGVDDLDTALFDDRHVVWRSTIPAGSMPATNMLTAFDTALQMDRLAPGSLTAYTRLLGAGDALVRTDTDWVRNHGRPTSDVLDDVLAAPGVSRLDAFGPLGDARGLDPSFVDPGDPALVHVDLPDTTITQAWSLRSPLVLVGDAIALDQMVRAGLDPVDRPVLYLHDLDDEQLAAALAADGEVVVTDTNLRRRWSINSVTDAHTPVLPADAEVLAAEQRAVATDPDAQTVRLPGPLEVTASVEARDLVRERAAGHARLAFDGDRRTSWQHGTGSDPVGGWVQAAVDRPAHVSHVVVHVASRGGRAISEVRVDTDGASTTVPVRGSIARAVVGDTTSSVRVTITDVTGAATGQPVAIEEVVVRGDEPWRPSPLELRTPRTLVRRAEGTPAVARALARARTTLLLSRLSGEPSDRRDDEETTLVRQVPLPHDLVLVPDATRVEARLGTPIASGECEPVARLRDGQGREHLLRVTRAAGDRAGHYRGCGEPLHVAAGALVVENAQGVLLDHVAMGTEEPARGTSTSRTVPVMTTEASRTRRQVLLPATTAPTLVSSGQAWSPSWAARADGEDLGPPLVLGGYAAGWLVPPGTGAVTMTYRPQTPTRAAQWASLGVALGAAVAALGPRRERRRGRRS